jgi:hypothetical protein
VNKRGLTTLSIFGGDFPVAKSVEAGIAPAQGRCAVAKINPL